MSDDVAAILEAIDLYRFFHAGDDETLALRGVSLRVERGEVVALTGPSGSGKSTLVACLAGLDEPDGGTVRVNGETMTRRSEASRSALRGSAIGVLYQNTNLFDHMTLEQNLVLTQRVVDNVDRAAVTEVLDDVGLSDRAGAMPSTLSGGESARAGLAVALVNRPSLILADEPTGELDEVAGHRVLALLRQRADRGAAVVIVSHASYVAAAADRVIALRDGQIVQ